MLVIRTFQLFIQFLYRFLKCMYQVFRLWASHLAWGSTFNFKVQPPSELGLVAGICARTCEAVVVYNGATLVMLSQLIFGLAIGIFTDPFRICIQVLIGSLNYKSVTPPTCSKFWYIARSSVYNYEYIICIESCWRTVTWISNISLIQLEDSE